MSSISSTEQLRARRVPGASGTEGSGAASAGIRTVKVDPAPRPSLSAVTVPPCGSTCIASDGPVWIKGDAARLGQVTRNLLANAVRFAAMGGNVEVSCRNAGGEAELRVSDDGEGIAAELLPHVFEPFRQAERIGTQPQARLGLGLAIAAHIVRQHRGRISVESAGHGKGAAVTVRFPAIAAP